MIRELWVTYASDNVLQKTVDLYARPGGILADRLESCRPADPLDVFFPFCNEARAEGARFRSGATVAGEIRDFGFLVVPLISVGEDGAPSRASLPWRVSKRFQSSPLSQMLLASPDATEARLIFLLDGAESNRERLAAALAGAARRVDRWLADQDLRARRWRSGYVVGATSIDAWHQLAPETEIFAARVDPFSVDALISTHVFVEEAEETEGSEAEGRAKVGAQKRSICRRVFGLSLGVGH